ncbi:MAG: ABC transporter permease subunit [Dehalococcoidia bacterium]
MATQSTAERELIPKARGGPWTQAARRLVHKKVAFGALIVIVIIYGAGALAHWVAPESFRETPTSQLDELPNFANLTLSPFWEKDGTIFNSTPVGIFRSPNGGKTWLPSSEGIGNINVSLLSIASSEAGDTTLFAGTSKGVFRSTDEGETWEEVNEGLSNTNINHIVVSPNFEEDGLVFAALSGGVFRSTDRGESWSQVNNGFQAEAPKVFELAISPAFPRDATIFATASGRKAGSLQTSEGVFRSTDGGQTWEAVYEGNTGVGVDLSLVISPGFEGDGILYAGTSTGLLRFIDGGASWENINPALGARQLQDLIISPAFSQDSTLFAINKTGGIFRSMDGGRSWQPAQEGLTVTRILDVTISPEFAKDRTLFAGTVDGGLFQSVDGGDSWQQIEPQGVDTVLKKGPSLLNWPPSLDHPFGTDWLGRDYFSRIIYGIRTTVIITVASVLTGSLLIGLFMGATAGFFGGKIDNIILRVGEIFLAFPGILLVILIAATVRPRFEEWARSFESWSGIEGIVRSGAVDYFVVFAALTMFGWVGMARLVRGQILHLKESQYVDAARAMGASNARLITRHLLPNAISPVIVSVSMGMGSVAGAEIVLSFFGIGVQPPNPSLGRMIAENFGAANLSILRNDPHLILVPVFTIAIIIYAWNLLGDGLNDVLNPRTR